MKHRITLYLIMMLASATMFAVEAEKMSPAGDSIYTETYQMWVRCDDGKMTREQFYEFSNRDALQKADLSAWANVKLFTKEPAEDCTLSITVKVRVGWDSNFVEASATVSGIPCDDVVNAIKRLRAQLMAGIE
jgi:hypothetical protein